MLLDQDNQWKAAIQAYAQEIGIDLIGFADARPFDDLEPVLRAKVEAGLQTGFEHKVIEDRVDPQRTLPGAQSLVAIALAYPSQIPDPLPSQREARRGAFARASWGVDYHVLLRDKLDQLASFIEDLIPGAQTYSMVDTGALSDVAVAQRAGLGFIGRNSLLINPKFGSWLYLGQLVTNVAFERDEEVPNGCGDCYRCVTACPPNALSEEGMAYPKRCLSYQTQTKGYMPAEYRRKVTSVIYGCDICQYVCPYNQGVDFHHHPAMEPDPAVVTPELKPMLTMTNRDFQETFGHLSGAWRGKKTLQRNAIIALANYKDRSALPLLLEIMEADPRPMIRGTAAWAVSVIARDYNEAIIDCVAAQLESETDPETVVEMEQALTRLRDKRPARR